jgi:hypothetical protein
MLNIAGTIIIQDTYEEIDLFIPIDVNTIVGEIQVLVVNYIDLNPNKFIMTGISKKGMIYLINVDDKVIKLINKGMGYLLVYEHIYDINFLSYRNLSISMKKLQFYNQKFDIQFYVHDQMTINILKQLIFDRVHKLYETNFGLEFETAEGYLFDDGIAATLKKNEVIGVSVFEFDGGEADMESNNNLTIYELKQQVLETFCLDKNIKLFSNMKKVNKNMYIKNLDKFQKVFKNIDKQFSMC